jgi:hypothetical protein
MVMPANHWRLESEQAGCLCSFIQCKPPRCMKVILHPDRYATWVRAGMPSAYIWQKNVVRSRIPAAGRKKPGLAFYCLYIIHTAMIASVRRGGQGVE